jgi:hypothetical protein
VNSAEFKTWLDNHVTLIPSVRSWLNKQPAPDRVLEEWQRILSRYSLEACCEASRAILSGDIERPFAEDTPATIRIWASEIDSDERQELREKESVSCDKCKNTGFASIYHHFVIAAVIENKTHVKNPSTGAMVRVFRDDGAPLIRSCAIACSCSLGARFASGRKRVGKRWVHTEPYRLGDSRFHIVDTGDYESDLKQVRSLLRKTESV